MGELSCTKDPLSANEIAYIFQTVVTLFRPWGLLTGIYFLSALTFNLRKVEVWRLTYGHFHVVSTAGVPSHIEYIKGDNFESYFFNFQFILPPGQCKNAKEGQGQAVKLQ